MDLHFKTEKLANECNNTKLLQRTYGDQRAKLMRRRLDSLRAAVTLADLRNLPGRLHELKGDRKWQLSFDLDGPNRLIFVANHHPIPTHPDGGMDWSQITAVTILGVEDTHA